MKNTKNYVSKQRQIKRGVTLVIFMGGTIWGHHFDKGAKPTICISDFLHYSITFGQITWKVQLQGHNFSIVHGRHNLGVPFWPDWQSLEFILLKFLIISLGFVKKHETKQRKLQIQGHNFSQTHGRHNLWVPFLPERQTYQLLLLKSFMISLRFV